MNLLFEKMAQEPAGQPDPISRGTPPALMERNPLHMCHSPFSKLHCQGPPESLTAGQEQLAQPRVEPFTRTIATLETCDTQD